MENMSDIINHCGSELHTISNTPDRRVRCSSAGLGPSVGLSQEEQPRQQTEISSQKGRMEGKNGGGEREESRGGEKGSR